MSNPVQLEETVSDLRKRMAEAGCVFEFMVSSVPMGVQVSESDHRHALENLFKALHQSYEQLRLDSISRDPSLETWTFFKLKFETAQPTATLIDAFKVRADGASWLQRLGEDFLEWGKRPDIALFAAFCTVVGLERDAVVIDWVGDEDDGGAWSNYFNDQEILGTVGVWCATIWNPTNRMLSAIVANHNLEALTFRSKPICSARV